MAGDLLNRKARGCALPQPCRLLPQRPHRPIVLGRFWRLGGNTAAILYPLISESGRRCRSKAVCISAHACETNLATGVAKCIPESRRRDEFFDVKFSLVQVVTMEQCARLCAHDTCTIVPRCSVDQTRDDERPLTNYVDCQRKGMGV